MHRCAPGGDVPLKNADYMYRVKYNKYATTSGACTMLGGSAGTEAREMSVARAR